MVLRNRPVIFAQFMLYSLASFLIVFFIGIGIRDTLFSEFVGNIQGANPIQIINSLIIYALVYIVFDIILLFSFTLILNMVYARVLNLEVGRIAVITIIALVGGFLAFHTVMYIWFYTGDPLKLSESGLIEYMLNLFLAYPPEQMDNINDLAVVLPDVFLKLFYDQYFRNDPSIVNYFILYLLLKGFVSDVPFEMAGLPFNFYKIEVWIVLIIYLIIFIPLFFRFIKGCECATEEEISDIKEGKKEKLFGKQQESGVIGEYVVPEPKKVKNNLSKKMARRSKLLQGDG